MAQIYYDLSEQFFASGSRFKYYGISRTVMEIGYELACADSDVRFVIFSPAHDRFFEVNPRIGAASPTGVMDPNVPHEVTPIRLRYSFPKPNRLRNMIYPLVQRIVRGINRHRWQKIPEGAVREVDLSGQILISLGRPKIMADYLVAMGESAEKIRFFPLLHDMIPLYEFARPSQTMFSSNFVHDNRIVIHHAEGLLSNSNFTKQEIERFAASNHLPPIPRVTAVPLSHELRPTEEPVTKTGPKVPYLMCVGILTGRKNLECVIGAMMHLQAQGKDVPDLVLAGARRKRAEQYINRTEYGAIRDKIHIILDPNQSELRGLYQNALALIIPSHMEGWGLPLGEALWLGTPGLASTAAALKEVGGDLAQYFAPEDAEKLAGYIDAMQSDPDYYAALKAKVKSNHKQLRSWRHVAHDVLVAVS